MFSNVYKKFSWLWFADYGMIVVGSIIMAAGYSFFADPLKIIPGGVYGIAIVFHHLYGFSTGTVGLILNIPLFLLGIYILGPKFGVKTFVGTILTSFFMDLFSSMNDKALTNDVMLGSIFSGVLIGGGLALIFRAKATTGGSDIVAQIINKYTKISMKKSQKSLPTISTEEEHFSTAKECTAEQKKRLSSPPLTDENFQLFNSMSKILTQTHL